MTGHGQKTTRQRAEGRAVVYLRVSSRGQVDTDYDPEGNSIPAQRKACLALAERMGLEVVDEYVEPGKSGRSIDGRPAFRKMMGRVRNEGDVAYIVVYMRSRLFRDTADAAFTKKELRGLGVTILSVKDPTDDSPTGDLMAHMVDGFNEYQSRVSGQDIAYKMEAKAARGGTPGRAPLGYLNVREMVEGREVRTVTVDPVRGPLVRMLFERYATGQFSFKGLRKLAISAGLRTRPTKTYPAGTELSIHKIGQILRDRYYLGFVSFNGAEYPGRHESLIDAELFDRVQAVLVHQRGAGTRERKWDHYLKGLVWCARCGRRLIIERGKAKSGRLYFYYLCMGRNEGDGCKLPRFPVADVEKAVAAHYATIALSPDEADWTREGLERVGRADVETTSALKRNLKRERKWLAALEDQVLDLIGDPDWPTEKLTAKIQGIKSQREAIEAQLSDSDRPKLGEAVELLLPFLDLLSRPRAFYESVTDDERKILNSICFTRLHLDSGTDQRAAVVRGGVSESIAPLVAFRDHERRNGTCPKAGAVFSMGKGSSTNPMVELRGFEPLTFSMPWKRATNCAKAP
jgi:site-specific DNA recombinase